MADRTAIDTIKGYFYQFDYSICQLLELQNGTDLITIEGIEDVDIKIASEETAIQCKYYSKTEYNHSVIAKPIRLMLNHYKLVLDGSKKQINYKLYGFYESGQEKLTLPINSTFLKENFLTFTKNKVKYYHYNDLKLTDKNLDDFIELLEIDIVALEYKIQISKIIKLLMKEFNCNEFESENFYYNNALKIIKDISVINGDVKNRQISKSDFLNKINYKKVLFNEWFIKYKGESKLFSDLRSQYFSDFNVSPFERFFLIEIPVKDYLRSDLKDLILTISLKWSKLSKREVKLFCPYIYLHNIPENELLEIKKEFHIEGINFTDGFDFYGADFSLKSITKIINKENPIRLRIIDKLNYLEPILNEISKTKEIYQFYFSKIFFNSIFPNIKQVNIQLSKINDLKKII